MTTRVVTAMAMVGLLLCVPRVARSQVSAFNVPPEYRDIEGFVRTLEHAGLTVQRIEDDQQGRTYTNLKTSAFLETNRGDLKIAVFPGDSPLRNASITYLRDDRRGLHRYRVDGVVPRMSIALESGRPLYFTIGRTWLVETRDAAMDWLIKQAVEQVRDDVETTSRAPR